MVKKAELHVHLEGTATPSLVTALAQRNKIKIPTAIFGKNETYLWNDFAHFQISYDVASSVIRTPEDYYDITYNYLKRCAAEDAIYVELTASSEHALMGKLSYQNLLEGLIPAMAAAKRDYQIESRVIMVCVRHFGLERCERVIETMLKYPHPMVTGINLAGMENEYPAGLFKHIFKRAHDAGLFCTAHAGEAGGPPSVWETIDTLPVRRIGHGVRSIEDPHLIHELIKRNMTLEVCPNSNVALKFYKDFASHPFLKLREAGVKLTLNSDDPPFFATSIGKEYDDAKKHFHLDDEELLQITRNSIEAAFMDEETKQTLLKTL